MRLVDLPGLGRALVLAMSPLALHVVAPPASAATRLAIPPGLQQAALLCVGEALRLCPNALAAKDHGLACILGKRRLLSAPCRTVYDQGLSLLNGGDVHLDLRALRAKPPHGVTPKVSPAPKAGF